MLRASRLGPHSLRAKNLTASPAWCQFRGATTASRHTRLPVRQRTAPILRSKCPVSTNLNHASGMNLTSTSRTNEDEQAVPLSPLASEESPAEMDFALPSPLSHRTKPHKFPLRKLVGRQPTRSPLLHVIATTSSAEEAWRAYSDVVTQAPPGVSISHFRHLRRLCRLLARNRPKTRTQFLRLLSVLTTIYHAGGWIRVYEWNALIDHAGKGWRKTRPEDYRLAFSIYLDMTTGKAPGTTAALNNPLSENPAPPIDENKVCTHATPDIHTYDTLISLASHTLDGQCILHASKLHQESGLASSRITHLSMLPYYTATNKLAGVRATLRKLEKEGLGLELDGANACIWAFGRNYRLDVVWMIYRVLRHNDSPDPEDADEVAAMVHQLREDEGIIISEDTKPDEVTYTAVIQLMAYQGDLLNTLTVFADMMSSEGLGDEISSEEDDGSALATIYRAIFLGFSRHGIHENSPLSPTFSRTAIMRAKGFVQLDRHTTEESVPTWTLSNLLPLFDIFIDSYSGQPSRAMIHWLMVAFDKTSNQDIALLRKVWKDLETKFHIPYAGPDNRLTRWQTRLFPEGVQHK